MPFYLLLLVRTLHFLFMAIWIGAAMMMPGDVKRSFASGVPASAELELLRGRVRLGTVVAIVGAWGTILSGLGMIFLLGGFASVPKSIHAGLALAIVLMGLGGAGLGKTWHKLNELLGDGKGAQMSPEVVALLRRYRVAAMVFKSIWLVILLLMVFRGVLG
jgi:hypothetical protein